jgi:Notch-like protein
VCTCAWPYTGPNCTIVNCDATPSPCYNGGTCENGLCTCPCPYTGNFCQTVDNTDFGNICENGATNCIVTNPGTVNASRICECAAGWSGSLCQTTNCTANPTMCLNGGHCTSQGSCACPCNYDSIASPVCQYWTNPPLTCANGGQCVVNLTTAAYSCNCPSGWGGTTCSQPNCMTNPSLCQNGGSCVMYQGTPLCDCPCNWGGATCSSPAGGLNPYCNYAAGLGYCESAIWASNGLVESVICACNSPYYGTQCTCGGDQGDFDCYY